MIASVFDEAARRDPDNRRPWAALIDGNVRQISRIEAEAATREAKADIVADFVHALEHLWKAAWCLFAEGDRAAEAWAAGHALRIPVTRLSCS
ncbi:MAG: hypothetical protein ACRDYX_08220 [Egibacteraceae bacterium]